MFLNVYYWYVTSMMISLIIKLNGRNLSVELFQLYLIDLNLNNITNLLEIGIWADQDESGNIMIIFLVIHY